MTPMPTAFYVMLLSGLLLLVALLLFRAESVKGRRLLLSKWRGAADVSLERRLAAFVGVKKMIGASSLRLFMHYLLHQVLGAGLWLARFMEAQLHRLRAKNKVVAKDLRSKNEDNHLHHIAEHKNSLNLTDEERERIKERSLED